MSGQPWSDRTLHFVGIGGAGMSGLANVALTLGATVSGTDRTESELTSALRERGATVSIGHGAEHYPAGAELVYSTAIPVDNPERQAAQAGGGIELHRSELLAQAAELKRVIAVSGTHGKTTTTSMLVHALRELGADPAYFVGGAVGATGENAEWGSGDWAVVEADESDRSLLRLAPEIAVVTNVELDHHTTYGSRKELDATVAEFLRNANQAIVWDRPELVALAPAGAEIFSVDLAKTELGAGTSNFKTVIGGREVDVALPVPGHHNALNAAAALSALALAGFELDAAAAALASFVSPGRRFQLLGEGPNGCAVYDDYAHHPTELRATLEAARTFGAGRVVAVFQPHLYSRTQALATEFGAALALADVAVVLGIYKARELQEQYPGVTGLLIAEAAADSKPGLDITWLPERDDTVGYLAPRLRPDDLLLTIGAGDVNQIGAELVALGGSNRGG